MAAWLGGLGLERYAETFREHEVDFEVLGELAESDLEKLAIPLGHRKKLLRAIAALTVAESQPAATALPVSVPARAPEAERRQLTVLFSDLVGSTALSGRLDPEDMGQVIRAYQGCCTEVVERWGGHVAKYMGDGVLAYFGWPHAHEDEAERAVRAGLAIIEALAELATPAGEPLLARVGIATGLVMVGELIGDGAAKEQTVVGETPNLAARLQTLAAPASVVISQATRRLLGGLFELSDLGPRRLKGFAEPLAAWRVEGEGRAEGRFEALHGERLAPLVGREHELSLLLDRFERAREGEGQVILLAGEAGIGKSRIVRALRERLAKQAYMPLSHYCSPYHTNSPLHPVIGLMERAAGFEREDPPAVRLAKLEALLALSSERLDEVVPLVAALLGVPVSDDYPPLNLAPQSQKQRTLEVLVDQVAGLAAEQPVLATYEDVHWIDPTSSEALGRLIDRVQRLPVLVLITYRPEFNPPWSSHPHVMQLSLTRLTRAHGAAIVERITGGKALPPEVLDQILARTDGVPLFVEELTKTVLETGLLHDAGDRYELAGPLPPLAIPSSLHDSLMARLDRLAPVKEVAQTAAVIGREFSYKLLVEVSPLPEDQLGAALDQLVSSELIFRRGAPPDATYSFKHALVQDVAYQSLLKGKRQQLHARTARLLEERFPEMAAAEPEALARHYAEASLVDEAIACWQRAARNAIERSANLEAAGFLRSALEVLSGQQESSERRRTEARLQLSLGAAFIAPKGYAAEEVRTAFARAEELSRPEGDRDALFLALRGLWNCHVLRAELREASALAEQLIDLAHEPPTAPSRLLMAYRAAGTSCYQRGDRKSALDYLQRGESLWMPEMHQDCVILYGEDPGVFCRVYGFLIRDLMGWRDRALRDCEQAAERAPSYPDRFSLAVSLAYASMLHVARREPSPVRRYAEACIELCMEQQIPQWQAWCAIERGWALAAEGEVQGGLAVLRQGLAQWRAIQSQLALPHFLALLAQVLRLGQAYAEAGQVLAQAEEVIRDRDHRVYEAEVYQEQGELALAKDDAHAAEHHFRRAIACAEVQDTKTWELRAATSLARLWAEQGKRSEAHDLLAPLYAWFTEGFDTADLQDAKALLDELR